MRDCQPIVSVGSVKRPNKASEIPISEHCGKKHRGKYWKLTKVCFRCGSLEHFAREHPKNENKTPDDAQKATSIVRGRWTSKDPGSSHSYVNTNLLKSGSMKSEMSRVAMSVSSPLSQTMLVDQIGDSKISNIQTVYEFSDVFPEELLRLPPDREVEFTIEVFFGTTLVSTPPYRMARTKLKELKIQLQDLLDRGFIHPSISH
ncbi:DNA/RNA polymerases superfamily protein [Gossypium australe]|uniref:DNA/RNA polymerases superfamily protein n=1 Tax=Gossypium australe TaxID=47621 RepID=A0A5B6X2L7_9ROSI|nr:DNA/RNA polymerases superfamily protein [Gossypium australe]